MAFAHRTYTSPVALKVENCGEEGSWYFLTSIYWTRPLASVTILDATLLESTCTCGRSRALASVFAALYFAWTGQIGTQLLLPWQRPPMNAWTVSTAPTGWKPAP